MLRRSAILLALFGLMLACLTPRPALAQNGDEEREATASLFTIFGDLDRATQVEQQARRTLEKHADRDVAPNPMIGIDDAGPAPHLVTCLDEPRTLRARYSVLFVDQAPRFDPQRGGFVGRNLDEAALAGVVATAFMPDKLEDGQPGVGIAINRGEKDWAFSLDEAWPQRQLAHDWLSEIIDDDVHGNDAVCAARDAVEALLERAEEKPLGQLVLARDWREKREAVAKRFRQTQETIRGDIGHSAIFETRVTPEFARVRDGLDEARAAIDDANFDAVAPALERCRRALDEAEAVHLRVMTLRRSVDPLRARLAELEERTAFRRQALMPFSDGLSDRLQACQRKLEAFESAAEDADSISGIEAARSQVEPCLDDLDDHFESTQSDFEVVTFFLPFGVGTAAIVLLLAFVASRARRVQEGESDRSHRSSQWARWVQYVPMMRKRLGRLTRKYPAASSLDPTSAQKLGLSDAEIDTIDHAWAVTNLADELLSRGQKLAQPTSLFNLDEGRAHIELVETGESQLTPENTEETTLIRDGLRESETIAHAELLGLADRLTRRAADILERRFGGDSTH